MQSPCSMSSSGTMLQTVAVVGARSAFLLFRMGSRLCGVPVQDVVETLRALPVEPMEDMPRFVRGLSVVRGLPLPVIDLEVLLTGAEGATAPARIVVLRVGERRVALAVDEVLGVREIDPSLLHELPPLLRDAGGDLIEAIGVLDQELLIALRSGRILPEELRQRLPPGELS